MSDDQYERDIQVHADVLALGSIVCPPTAAKACKTALGLMPGQDWTPMPYSLARSIHDTLELHIVRKLPYLAEGGGHKLIQWDGDKGELRMTELGNSAMGRLRDRIRARL